MPIEYSYVFFPLVFYYMHESMTLFYLKTNVKIKMTMYAVPEKSVYWESNLKTLLDSEQFIFVKDNNS